MHPVTEERDMSPLSVCSTYLFKVFPCGANPHTHTDTHTGSDAEIYLHQHIVMLLVGVHLENRGKTAGCGATAQKSDHNESANHLDLDKEGVTGTVARPTNKIRIKLSFPTVLHVLKHATCFLSKQTSDGNFYENISN